ncbi:MAG: DUF6782 family putative metallopeptidase [Pseudomonadota bacterium]
MRHALTFGAGLLALTHAFPEKASAEDVQSALVTSPDNQTETVDPDSLVSLSRSNYEGWRAGRQDLCLMYGEAADSEVEQRLDTLVTEMRQAPLADRLFNSLEGTSATVCSSRAHRMPAESVAQYLLGRDAAVLRLGAERGELMFSALHETRHSWQDQNGALGPVFEEETLQDHLAMIYMVEADATAFAVAAAWQLREAGDPAAWDYAMSDPDYQPVADIFERAMAISQNQEQNQGMEPHAAMRNSMRWAYTAWFEASRASVVYATNLWPELQEMPNSDERPAQFFSTLLRGLGQVPGQTGSYLGNQEAIMAIRTARQLIPLDRPEPAAAQTDGDPAPAAQPELR